MKLVTVTLLNNGTYIHKCKRYCMYNFCTNRREKVVLNFHHLVQCVLCAVKYTGKIITWAQVN